MIIWDCQSTEIGIYEVGHRNAAGEWMAESEHADRFTARARIEWLTKRDAELDRHDRSPWQDAA